LLIESNLNLQYDGNTLTATMPDGASLLGEMLERRAMPSQPSDQQGPIAVVSVRATRTGWLSAFVLGATIIHGLLFAALSLAMLHPVDQVEPATIEMIEVPVVRKVEPDPGPPPEPTPATTAEAAVPDPVPDLPLPTPALPEPVPLPQNAQPEPQPMLQQAPPAEAPVEPAAADVSSIPPVPAPLPIAATGDPEPSPLPPRHARPRPAVPKAAAALVATKSEAINAGAIEAVRPSATDSVPVDHLVTATLTGRIRAAVQAAVQCPAAARMMGQSGTAGVAFDYRDGALVGGLQLARSTGLPVLDAAALTAVRNARYPEPPPEASNHVLYPVHARTRKSESDKAALMLKFSASVFRVLA